MLRATVVVAAIVLVSCSGNSTDPSAAGVADISMAPESLSVAIGDSAAIRAQPVSAAGTPVRDLSLFWSTSDSTIASVDQQGMVRAVGIGSVNIDASTAGVSPKRPARVVVVATPVASIVISPTSATLRVGGALQFADTTKDAAGHVVTGRTVVWRCSDTTVAIVDQAGLVVGKKHGSVTIAVASGSVSATAAVTVKSGTQASVASIAVSVAASAIVVGRTTVVTAVSKDADGNVLSGRTVEWSTSKSHRATVSAGGIDPATQLDTATVNGAGKGEVTITATGQGKQGSVSLTVTSGHGGD